MKRPQFGIRLMLLVVALFATIFAWRHAVWEEQHDGDKYIIKRIEDAIKNATEDDYAKGRVQDWRDILNKYKD